MATHSSILAWRIPCTEESDGLQSMGLQRVRHDCAVEQEEMVKNLPVMQETWFQSLGQEDPLAMEMANHFSIYSCLDNATDRGAWQTTVHGVARVGHDLATKPPPP